MQTPYGFEMSENCLTCKFRRNTFFCGLSSHELHEFNRIKSLSVCPAGTVLLSQDQDPKGFFVVCEGEIKLYFSSSTGNTFTMKFATAGDAIGLWAVLFNSRYEASAETLCPCQVAFVSSMAFRQYLAKYPNVFQRALNYVGLHYKAACEHLAAVGLGTTVVEKMANFLLDWSAKKGATSSKVAFQLSLTQEDIASHIGVTRESVARAMGKLKKRGLVITEGDTYSIPDRAALLCAYLRPLSKGPQLVRLGPAATKAKSRADSLQGRMVKRQGA